MSLGQDPLRRTSKMNFHGRFILGFLGVAARYAFPWQSLFGLAEMILSARRFLKLCQNLWASSGKT